MRTAESILYSNNFTRSDHETDFEELVKLINDARIETIVECAENAQANYEVSQGGYVEPFVDKQSILSLIEQVK